MVNYDAQTKTWSGPVLPSILNPEASIGQLILDQLARTPSKVVQINADDGSEMTCAEMRQRIIRVALNLKKLGYKKGDLVSLVCSNSENVTPVYGGCMVIGLVVMVVVIPISLEFNKDDMALLMRLAQSKVVFCDETNRETVEKAVRESNWEKPRIYVMGKSAGSAAAVDELLAPVNGEESFEPEYLGDSKKLMAVVVCSSGTTGAPKGICLSHARLIDGMHSGPNAGLIFNFCPLSWISGLNVAQTSLLSSRPRLITTQPFSAEAFFSMVEKYQVRQIFTAPSCIAAVQSHPSYETATLSSLYRWNIGGSSVSTELLASLSERFRNIAIKPIYGISEVGIITSPIKSFAPGSVGSLANNVLVKVIHVDGHRLGPNEKGEIYVKSNHTFLGYFNDEQMTRDAFDEENFFKTGDIGYFDSDGYLYIIDRIKDIIIYKNYRISPSDLENVIQQMEGVKQVCVTGVPTADLSWDLPAALVVLQNGSGLSEIDVLESVNSQVVDHKRLRGGVYFTDKLPMSPVGKVLRRVAKQMIVDIQRKQ